MSGQIKKYNTYMDKTGSFAYSPNPYELPKSLGFNISKASKYAKERNIKISQIPVDVLTKL